MLKKYFYITLFCIVILLLNACNTANNSSGTNVQTAAGSVPFTKGFSLPGWFIEYYGYTTYTEDDFIELKSLGADMIRLSIGDLMHNKKRNTTSSEPDYIIHPGLLSALDTAVDYAEKHGIYIVLSNHYDWHTDGLTDIEGRLLKIWPQIAEHFKNRSDFVLYEIMNEPMDEYNGMPTIQWGNIQRRVIDAIRRIDNVHTIVVTPQTWGSISALGTLPDYKDKNLIYTFHFYDPPIFTSQGHSFTNPFVKWLPFPFDANSMPVMPQEIKGTWLEPQFKNYAKLADRKTLAQELDKAVAFSRRRGVPIWVGEYGEYGLFFVRDEDRIRYFQTVTELLEERNIPHTVWNYHDSGIWNNHFLGDVYSDLNVAAVRALGFTPPEQKAPEPIREGFYIYKDMPLRKFSLNSYMSEFEMYFSTQDGSYLWKNPAQYSVFRFYGEPFRSVDWALLISNNYILQFRAKAEKDPGITNPVEFSVMLINEESKTSIPWRVIYKVNETILPSDGNWHTVRIPLSSMKEQGAYISATGEWRNPAGKFNADLIRELAFSADEALPGCSIWFNDIQLTEN